MIGVLNICQAFRYNQIMKHLLFYHLLLNIYLFIFYYQNKISLDKFVQTDIQTEVTKTPVKQT